MLSFEEFKKKIRNENLHVLGITTNEAYKLYQMGELEFLDKEPHDLINSPTHYTQANIQLEPIDILRYAPFDLGNCLKYLLRAGHKEDKIEDLQKAQKYLELAIESYPLQQGYYYDFFTQYGLLLKKFERFKEMPVNTGFINVTGYLQRLIDKELKNGN